MTSTNSNNIVTSSRGIYGSRNSNVKSSLSPSKYSSTSPYRLTNNNNSYLSSVSPSARARNVSFGKQDTRSPRISNDTVRLLMPVISTTLTTTKTTTTNIVNENDVRVNEVLVSGGAKTAKATVVSPSTSIVDESKMLLREYEQLRTDSVSEIQRAHDSLNASLKWLENQKLK